MAKKYYAWKNANCNGHNPEWIEMSGIEFLHFKRRPENKKRLFIELHSFDSEEDTVVIEATKERYNEWNKENMRYLRNEREKEKWNISVLSFDCEKDGGCTLYDEVSSEDDVETDVIRKDDYSRLHKALNELTDEERQIMNALYFADKRITERCLANKLGISFQLLNYKKKKILEKLKNVF